LLSDIQGNVKPSTTPNDKRTATPMRSARAIWRFIFAHEIVALPAFQPVSGSILTASRGADYDCAAPPAIGFQTVATIRIGSGLFRPVNQQAGGLP
jgi:hypothetical protein